jgi:hypothetical protein
MSDNSLTIGALTVGLTAIVGILIKLIHSMRSDIKSCCGVQFRTPDHSESFEMTNIPQLDVNTDFTNKITPKTNNYVAPVAPQTPQPTPTPTPQSTPQPQFGIQDILTLLTHSFFQQAQQAQHNQIPPPPVNLDVELPPPPPKINIDPNHFAN